MGADGCAGADALKKFGNQGEKVRVSIWIMQMISDGSGMKSRGFDGRSGVRAGEHVRRLLIRGPAKWACIQVKMVAFEKLQADT